MLRELGCCTTTKREKKEKKSNPSEKRLEINRLCPQHFFFLFPQVQSFGDIGNAPEKIAPMDQTCSLYMSDGFSRLLIDIYRKRHLLLRTLVLLLLCHLLLDTHGLLVWCQLFIFRMRKSKVNLIVNETQTREPFFIVQEQLLDIFSIASSNRADGIEFAVISGSISETNWVE